MHRWVCSWKITYLQPIVCTMCTMCTMCTVCTVCINVSAKWDIERLDRTSSGFPAFSSWHHHGTVAVPRSIAVLWAVLKEWFRAPTLRGVDLLCHHTVIRSNLFWKRSACPEIFQLGNSPRSSAKSKHATQTTYKYQWRLFDLLKT